MREVQNIRTVDQLLAEVEKAKADARERAEADPGLRGVRWLYRGQSRCFPAGQELLPSIYRAWTWGPSAGDGIVDEGAYNRDAEREMLQEFERLAGQYAPKNPATAIPDLPTAQLDWLALARHHELPTRLLDWTLCPRTALWFALWGDNRRPTVWMLPVDRQDILEWDGGRWWVRPARENLKQDRPDERHELGSVYEVRGHGNRTLFFNPDKASNPRAKAQAGWLGLFPDRREGREGPQTSLETNGRYKDKVLCFRIDHCRRADLQKELTERHNIRQRCLFHDLDGLSQHLHLRHLRLRVGPEK